MQEILLDQHSFREHNRVSTTNGRADFLKEDWFYQGRETNLLAKLFTHYQETTRPRPTAKETANPVAAADLMSARAMSQKGW